MTLIAHERSLGEEGWLFMNDVNIEAVFIADLMAVTMLFIALLNCRWRLGQRTKKTDTLFALILLSLTSCVVDFLSDVIVGKPGTFFLVVDYLSNFWLYLMNMVVGLLWISFLSRHLGLKLPAWMKSFFFFVVAISAIPLVINFAQPCVFSIDASGVYRREPLFWYYVFVDVALFLVSVAIYVYVRMTGGTLKMFPLWVFAVPAILGIVIQSCMYGVSTIWPFIAVALNGVTISLQSELVFRDKLTGLYNRFYLDGIADRAARKSVLRKRAEHFTILWMDVNDFKTINDEYGHAVGDKALVAVGAALTDAVGALGTVMRYSGDEFVVLLNTQDAKQVDACVDAIASALESIALDEMDSKSISASIGCFPFDPATYTMDEALNHVDMLMYKNKRAYHAAGSGHDRRCSTNDLLKE